jgi:hypothetical protein
MARNTADALDRASSSSSLHTDALQAILKDIGKVDLLTAAQEVQLAKRI